MADISDQQIRDYYAQHKGDANLGEQALRAMRETGLTRERINSVLKPETTRVWSVDDYVDRTDPEAEAAMAKLWGDVDQAEKQQEWSAFTAANPLDTNAATGRGTGTDVSKYTDRQQTLQDFLKENAAFINPDGTIKSPELGGNYHYSGQNAIDVYKKNIGQTYNTYETATGTRTDPSVYNNALSLAWIPGVENKGSFLEGLAKVGLAGAGMYFGLPALLGGAATGAGAASGLAGMAGMDAGMAATALNSGALNTGMNLLRGQNIGDAIKGGATSALLSPIGTLAGNAATSAFSGYGISPELLKAIGTTTGSAATGAARAVATGKPLGRGFIDGAVDGLVASAGNYVGGRTAGAMNSKFAGTAANNLTRASLRGGVNKNTINSLAEMYASGKLTDLSGLEPEVARAIVSVAARRTTPVGALSRYIGAVGSKSMRKATVGGR